MTDKEKEAIKSCNLLLNGDITLHIIDDDGGTAYAGAVNKLYNEDLETVLNLIQKQQEEIEEYEKTLDIFDEREYRKRYLEEERAKRKGLLYPDADEIYKRYYEQKDELEKKDKIIDGMAECIYKNIDMLQMLDIAKSINYDLEKVFNGLEDKEVLNIIKEYFKNKVEKE